MLSSKPTNRSSLTWGPRTYVKSYGVLQTVRDRETAHRYILEAALSRQRWADWPPDQERRGKHSQRYQEPVMNKWLHLVELLAEPILAVAGVPPVLNSLIISGIQEAETIKGDETGTAKLQHVINLVGIGANAANAAAGKTVINATALTSTVIQGINTTIAAVNLVHGATPATV